MAIRTLIIENDNASVSSVINALQHEDVTIDIVQDGVEGMLILHENPYDMLMINIMPNGCNGMELIRHIKNRFQKILIIVLADSFAKDFESVLLAAKKCGASYCFTKPLQIDQIVKITRQTLKPPS